MITIVEKNNTLYVSPIIDGMHEALSFKHSFREKKKISFFSRKSGKIVNRLVDGPIRTQLVPMYAVGKDNTLVTYSGLKQRLVEFLDSTMETYSITKTGKPLPTPDTSEWIYEGLHQDQRNAVEMMLAHDGGCMLEAATSAGKTYVIAALCRAYTDYTGLIVTNRQSVAMRLYDSLVDLCPDSEIGIYVTGKKRKGKTMIITAASLKKFKPSDISYIVFDECIHGDSMISVIDDSVPQNSTTCTSEKKIRNARAGDMIASFDENNAIVKDRIVSVINKGKRPTWKICLQNGKSLTCTFNEKIKTDRGWVYLAQLLNPPTTTRNFIGRCFNGLESKIWKVCLSTWSKARSILQIQSKNIWSNGWHSAKDSSKSWMGKKIMPLQLIDFRTIRVLTNDVLRASGGGVSLQKECNFVSQSTMQEASFSGSQKKCLEKKERQQNSNFSPIISIEYVGEEEVWDIETEKYHTFFANGFGVHNCHGASGETRSADLFRFNNAVRYGMSATIHNEFTGMHNYLEAIFGPIVCRTTDEQVEDYGRASPLNVYIIDVNNGPDPDPKTQDLTMERHGIWYNRERNKLIKQCCDMAPDDQQLVVFVRTKYHLDHLHHNFLQDFTVYHGQLSLKEKKIILEGFNNGDIKRLISTDSLSEGVDPKALFITINANWMQSNVSVVQKAGRNRRLAEGKDFGIVIDFNDKWNTRFERKSKSKLSKYYNRGYNIIENSTPSSIIFCDT